MAEPFRGVVNVDRSMPPRTCQRGDSLIPSASCDSEGQIKIQPGAFALAGEELCVGRDSGEAVRRPGTAGAALILRG